MKISLRNYLTLSYIFIVTLTILLIGILVNFFLEKQFKDYVINNLENKSRSVATAVEEQYNSGTWNEAIIERVGMSALENGLILMVQDGEGNKVWDAREHNNGKCEAMIAQMAENMMGRYPTWKGGYVSKIYDLKKGDAVIGLATIGYYGPYYYNDNDLLFLKTLNNIFIVVEIISLLLAILAGIGMSRTLSKPILTVVGATDNISRGKYKSKVDSESNINELNSLSNSINDLAATLNRQELLRKRLTEDISHELRTPLTTLQSHMEAMIDGVWEPTKERIECCYEEVVRLKGLVGSLEKLAKYEADNIILNRSSFNISELINKININFQGMALTKNIKIVTSVEDFTLCADKDKISQVLINVISNAIKYTEDNGNILIKSYSLNNVGVVEIKDSGIGISKEDLPFIFERFYRADKSRNRFTGGAGIGLAITKSIVEAHNGSIKVESEVGKGTKFTILLPNNISCT